MRPLWLAAGLMAFAGLGCTPPPAPTAPSEPVKAPEPPLLSSVKDIESLLPAPGTTRRYKVTVKTQAGEVATVKEEALEFRFSALGANRKVAIVRGGKIADTQVWGLSGGRLALLSQGGRPFRPPLILAGLMDTEKPLEGKGEGPRADGQYGRYDWFISSDPVEEVDLAEGTAQAQPFQSQITWKTRKGSAVNQVRSWWAPQKGLVRQVESIQWEGVQREIVSVLDPGSVQGKSE